MKIGYSTWSMFTTPYQVYLPALHEIGYRAIALNVSPGGGRRPNATNLTTLSKEDKRRIRDECAQRGIEIDAVMGHRPMLSRDPEEAKANLQRLKDTIDFCVEIAHDRLPAMTSTAGGRPNTYAEDKQLLIERAGELAEYGRSRGVVFGLEAHANTCVSTPQRVQEIIGAVNSPYCRLDYDSSHFEVQLIPMEEAIPAVLPLTVVCDIKDQRVRYADQPEPPGWRIDGNGSDKTTSPGGRPIEWQWVIGGEGDHDLPKFLRLMHQHGWTGALCYEMSVHVQGRPGYDALDAAAKTYKWMEKAWKEAGIHFD